MSSPRDADIRYQPDERPPLALTAGLTLQFGALMAADVIVAALIVIRGGGLGDPYLTWAVFSALAVSGLATILQAAPLGRFGAGHILFTGLSEAFIAVSVTALLRGGPALLATLVLVSGLFHLLFASRLSSLRRVITPAVAGTVVMLCAVTMLPVVDSALGGIRGGAAGFGAPAVFAATLVVIVAVTLRGGAALRPWALLLGIAAGSAVALSFGLHDLERVLAEDWVGFPSFAGWPGLDLGFGPQFWALLPPFVLLTLVGSAKTVGNAISIQQVSWRERRVPDYRVVQGAVAGDGAANLMAALLGTVPQGTYANSVSAVQLTGVAARRLGVWIGVFFLVVACFPKFAAFFLTVPDAIVGAFLFILLALLFVSGVSMAFADGMDSRKTVIIGISFWVGVGFQQGALFAGSLGEFWGALLENGMTAGGLTAILLTVFLEGTGPRRRTLAAVLDGSAGRAINDFLAELARRRRWDRPSTDRLLAVGEEAVLSLMEARGGESGTDRMRLTARADRRSAELEFVAAPADANIEDRLAVLPDRLEVRGESELSLRLLGHYANSVRHRKYRDADIVTISVLLGTKP